MWDLFEEFEDTAFRLETRPAYIVEFEAEPFRRYLAGQPLPPEETGLEGWQNLLRRSLEAGKRISRVHAIEGPLTSYLRFEIDWAYPYNAAVGEDIRILHRDDLGEVFGADTPLLQDFWLFDDRQVLWMEYDVEGRFLGGRVSSDSSDVTRCLRLRQLALDHAVPLSTYLAAIRRITVTPVAVSVAGALRATA
jgi:hypothetical protein